MNLTMRRVVLSGESKHVHSDAMKEHTWVLGGESVTEMFEYKNLGVAKNYIGSFSTNADDNIDKTRKKAGMLFSSMPPHFTVWYGTFYPYTHTFS